MERHGLLLSLPFYFALGFALASLAHLVFRIRAPVGAAAALRREAGITAAVFAFFLFTIAEIATWRLGGFGLPGAAVALGGLVGWWFWTTRSARDRGVFAGVAAALLIAAALQYDTGVLSHGPKFNAAGQIGDPLRAPAFGSQESGSASPHTERTDRALDTIFTLPDFAIQDEQFAFALAEPTRTFGVGPALRAGAPEDALAFIDYGCEEIEPFAGELRLLQSVHRDENSALAIEPRTIAWLRRAYYALSLTAGQKASHAGAPAARSCRAPARIDSVGAAFCAAKSWADGELRSVAADAAQRIQAGDVSKVDEAFVARIKRGGVDLVAELDARRVFKTRCRLWPPDPLAAARKAMGRDWSRPSLFGAYFAIVAASALAAAGEVESAVQLLDRHIELHRDWVRATPARDDIENFWRRLALVRLETTQVDLSAAHVFTQGRNASLAEGWSLLTRMRQTVEDVEALIRSRFDAAPLTVADIVERVGDKGELAPKSADACAGPTRTLKDDDPIDIRYVVASLAFLDLRLRRNAIDILAQRPLLARAFPDQLPWYDASAALLAGAKFECFERLGYPLPSPLIPAFVQRSLGGYYEAEANRFGDDRPRAEIPGVDRDTPLAATLCRARDAYARAWTLLLQANPPPPPPPDTPTPYAGNLEGVDIQAFKTAVADAAFRSEDALYALPPFAVEKAKGLAPDCATPLPNFQ